MNSLVKRARSTSLAALVLFLTASSMTSSLRALRSQLPEVERLFFAIAMIEAAIPQTATVEYREAEFEESARYHQAGLLDEGPLLDVIKQWDESTYEFGGSLALSSTERVSFTRLRDDEDEQRLRRSSQEETMAELGVPIVRQRYTLHSLAFPERTYRVDFLDGYSDYHVDYYKKSEWGLASSSGNGFESLTVLVGGAVDLGARWSSAGADPERAYFAMRAALAQHQTKIPLLGWSVDSSSAAGVIAATAIYLSVILLQTVYGLREEQLDGSEPWLAVAAFAPRNRFEFLVKRAVSAVGVAAFLGALALPTLTVWTVAPDLSAYLRLPAGCVACAVGIVAIGEVVRMATRGHFGA